MVALWHKFPFIAQNCTCECCDGKMKNQRRNVKQWSTSANNNSGESDRNCLWNEWKRPRIKYHIHRRTEIQHRYTVRYTTISQRGSTHTSLLHICQNEIHLFTNSQFSIATFILLLFLVLSSILFPLSRPSTFSALIRCSFCTLLCRAFTFVRQTIESQSSLSLCNCPHLIEYDTFGRTLTDTKSNCAEHRSYRKQWPTTTTTTLAHTRTQ